MVASGLPFGVNLPIRFLKDDAMLRFFCDAGIRFVTTSAGIDGLVVRGAEGGGLKSADEVSTLLLLQAIRERVDVPLAVVGGIVDGCGKAAA